MRYKAAADATREGNAEAVSAAAREALFERVADPDEAPGVRLWASRAVADLEPERAVELFSQLEAQGIPIDGDAWTVLGPIALPKLMQRCPEPPCDQTTLLMIGLIISDSPTDERCREAVPFLLREANHSASQKWLAYQALGGFRQQLIPLLEGLEQHEDAVVRREASAALAAVAQE